MSQIKTSHLLLASLLALALGGCGDTNSKAVFSPESGHPANWSTTHKTAGKANLESCFECHGEELNGGIAKVSCTFCHIGSPEAIHPIQWGNYAYARHSQYVSENSTTSCATATCHGTSLSGVSNSGPSCTSCHLGGINNIHPTDWDTNGARSSHPAYVNQNGTTSCKTSVCHGSDLKGVFLSGSACDSCHDMPQQ